MNTLHSYLAYYLLAINAVTFILYGIDKYKAKKNQWRISEATLLTMAAIGGNRSMGRYATLASQDYAQEIQVWYPPNNHPADCFFGLSAYK